jgi:hypothetical protein
MPTGTQPTTFLSSIAHLLDAACAEPGPGLVVLLSDVAGEPDQLELALRALSDDQHPCDELRDLVAPPGCWGMALVVPGRAHLLDGPDEPAQLVVSTYVRHRDGRQVSLLRRGDTVTEQPGPTAGRLPELCRRVLEPSSGERRRAAP